MTDPMVTTDSAVPLSADDPVLQRDLFTGLASQSLRAMVSMLLVGTAFLLVFLRSAPLTAILWYGGFCAVQLLNHEGWFEFR